MSGKRTKQLMNGLAASEYGCIVSFENEHGAELTLHRAGPLRGALTSACAAALAADPTYRVTCYSTPQTIYDDMNGGRMDYDNKRKGWDGHTVSHRATALRPETALTRIGLGHMAHPRLNFYAADRESKRRARGVM